MTVSIGTLLIGGICLFLAGTFVGVGLTSAVSAGKKTQSADTAVYFVSESDTGRELEIFEKEKKRTYIVLQFAVGIDTSICRERNRSRVHFGHGF